MKKLTHEDPETKSAEIINDNIETLRALFPEAFTEGKVDFEVLRQLLGDTVDEREEKFGLNWHGKRQARQFALTPSTGTLRPCPEDSVDWDTTQNLMIEGDNLEVLKLLQKSYAGKVKLIYIDPPYNTGKDFVYPDNYQDNIGNYLELTGQLDEEGRKISSNSEASGRFHTDWLNMMYPRLKLSRNLLREDGAILISIDQGELATLQTSLHEIFGEENMVSIFSWVRTRTPAALSQKTKTVTEFIVCYEKTKTNRPLLGIEKPAQSANTLLNQPNAVGELLFPAGIDAGFEDCELAPGEYGSDAYRVDLLDHATVRGGKFVTPVRLRARFRWSQQYLEEQMRTGVSIRIPSTRLLPSYEKDSYGREALPNLIDDKVGVGTNENASTEVDALLGPSVASYPKPTSLLRYLVNSCTTDSEIVMDFFAGSGTTAHAVMLQNATDGAQRRYILVQLPEPLDPKEKEQASAAVFCDSIGSVRNLAEITKERLRRAARLIRQEHPDYSGDLGFRVFRLDSTNIRAWDPDPEQLDQTVLDSVNHLRDDRDEDDILYELLLKLGLDLCVPIERRSIAGKQVHSIGGGVLLACLATKIGADEVEPLAQGIVEWHEELAPAGETTCVFRDSAFADDVAKTNLSAILEQHELTNVRSL